MRIAGIDENGLGPRLGPLIVTGVVLEMPEVLPQKRAMTLVKRHGFDDSKRVCGFGHMQQAESRTLVLLEELWGQMPKTYHDLVSRLVGEGLDALMRPCPSSTRGQCWSNDFSLPCFDAELEEGRKAVAHLRKCGS